MKFIKDRWSDPVWSKVIAGVILGIGTILVTGVWTLINKIPFSILFLEIPNIFDKNIDSNIFDLSQKSNLLFWLSSGILYLIAAVILVFQTLFEKGSSLISRIGLACLGAFICLAISFVFYWLFGLIPQLDKNSWLWNYLVNLGIQTLLIVGPFSDPSMKRNNKKSPKKYGKGRKTIR